jgi:hypothetical protein
MTSEALTDAASSTPFQLLSQSKVLVKSSKGSPIATKCFSSFRSLFYFPQRRGWNPELHMLGKLLYH